jgi:molybdopterin-guanine dinucleotide biosynthesis protein A
MEHRDNALSATAIVLAGGKSSRMGTPKALLVFDGTPLIVRIVATLRPLFADVVVVTASGQDLPAMPVTLVRDEVAYQGPVGGIYYGLQAAGQDVSFVTACDSAFLNPRLIAHLVSQAPEYDVVVPHWQGRFQPLHSVYRRTVLPLLGEQLARGELRPVFLFDKVRTRRVDEDEIRRFDPDGSSFFNMNTPGDYEAALTRWNEGSIQCTVELFGVARLVAQARDVSVALSRGATVADVVTALADKIPSLVGRVIAPDRRTLLDGYACNVNGLDFVRSTASPVHQGDSIVILSADAGG